MLGLALTGCAAQSGMSDLSAGGTVSGAPGTALDENLNGFLAQAPAGAVVNLAESPWGANVEVIADAPYFSASGRECRKLRIVTANASNRQAVACETAEGWQARRLVTDATATTGSAR
ncbi:hypothetical protein GCM10017767_10970 [Halomonas urumqiensis]|nr:hypothetical protein GCM10017767_10970 [Halomonas urumqiensis]